MTQFISHEMVIKTAKAICRVFINGGDPEQPAIRWNGVEMELQEFPVWHDYKDEARAALEAVVPMVRNAALEEAATAARLATLALQLSQDEADAIEAAIRALATPAVADGQG